MQTNKQVNNVAIIGSGTMGARIAFQTILHGKYVHLHDINPKALLEATQKISNWLDEQTTANDKLTAMSRLQTFTDVHKCLHGVELLIENVPENLSLKQKVFADLDQTAAEGVIFLSNSSSIPASKIAVATQRPEYILNVNFNDPSAGEYLVEVMYHEKTLPKAVNLVESYLREIKCVPIVTHKEIMGFSFNRVWRAIKRENLHLVGNGYSHFEDLDRAWILMFDTPWGPFGLMDTIGLDVVRDIELIYYEQSGEERDKPPEFLERMIASGRLGVKSGQGFYSYPDPEYKRPGWLTKEPPWEEKQSLPAP